MILTFSYIAAEKIKMWLDAPDSSPNLNDAREKHQEGTSGWIKADTRFLDWKNNPGGFLWLYGPGKNLWKVTCCLADHGDNPTAGCGKTVLW